MRSLSLHQLVALGASPVELVRIAAELDCPHVCLFCQETPAPLPIPVVSDREMPELLRVMQDCGVTAYGVASFALTPGTDVASFEAALSRGARLGASRASVRIIDADEARATDNFGRFARLAVDHGIAAGIEFTGFGATGALAQAARIVTAANAGATLTLDALHVVRTGTSVAALRRLDPGLIGYLQLCDGPLQASAEDYAREGLFDRAVPGEGELPLLELLALVPADRQVSLEVPMERLRAQGVSPRERARHLVNATRRLMHAATRTLPQ